MLHLTEEAYKLAQPLASPPVREFLVPTQLHELFCWVHGLQVLELLLMNNWTYPFISSHWTWWESRGRTTTWKCSCCKMLSSWRGGTGGLCPTTHQGQTLAAMVAPCCDRVSRSWDTSMWLWSNKHLHQSNRTWIQGIKLRKSEIVPLHHRMFGRGSTWEMMPFGDQHHLWEGWWLHYLQVLKD